MTKTLSMASLKNYKLCANEGFVMFLTSMLIICFVDGFTSKVKSQVIAYFLNGSEHIYWILDLEDEVHSIWATWTSGLEEWKGIFFPKSGIAGSSFWSGYENFDHFFAGGVQKHQIPGPNLYPPHPETS